MATPGGVVLDWKKGEVEPIPGVTMPKLVVVKRDYSQIGEKMRNTLFQIMVKVHDYIVAHSVHQVGLCRFSR